MQSNKNIKRQNGFTLIEVLIAALIMFLVIVTMMSIYQGAMLSSQKATSALVLPQNAMQVRTLITEQIRVSKGQSQLSGSGQVNGIGFEWFAEKVAAGRPLHPNNIDWRVGAGFLVPYEGVGGVPVYLWDVYFTLSYRDTERRYEFSELSWHL
jgi:prepilin-type N-terminal cleavage/methylation domain-containing protein